MDANIHAMGAFMRAVENGYTVVRAARGGWLSITLPTGKTDAVSTLQQPMTTFMADVPIMRNTSFYAKHGAWFVWLLIGFLVSQISLSFRVNKVV